MNLRQAAGKGFDGRQEAERRRREEGSGGGRSADLLQSRRRKGYGRPSELSEVRAGDLPGPAREPQVMREVRVHRISEEVGRPWSSEMAKRKSRRFRIVYLSDSAIRARFKKTYGPLLAEIVLILDRYDPIGLTCVGAPPDEYSIEAAEILKRLGSIKSVAELQRTIRSIFSEYFSPELAGPVWRYKSVATQIWKVRNLRVYEIPDEMTRVQINRRGPRIRRWLMRAGAHGVPMRRRIRKNRKRQG